MELQMRDEIFPSEPAPTRSMFCICGTLIHVGADSSVIRCSRCKKENSVEMTRPIRFERVVQREQDVDAGDVKGARIKYQCPSCNSDEMMYSTAQLRSADEGQTVFYSCECGYRVTVQS